MSDLRTLDRQVAERLGWHGFHTRKDWYEHPDTGPYEQERLMGFAPSGDEREVPNWQHDMNAAMTLIEEHISDEYTPRLVRILQPNGNKGIVHVWKCVIMSNLADADDEYQALEPTPATAICEAWLAYTKATEADAQQADAGQGEGAGARAIDDD